MSCTICPAQLGNSEHIKGIATHPAFIDLHVDFLVLNSCNLTCSRTDWSGFLRCPVRQSDDLFSVSGVANMPAFSANAYFKFNDTFAQSVLCVQREPVVMVTQRDINHYQSQQRQYWQQWPVCLRSLAMPPSLGTWTCHTNHHNILYALNVSFISGILLCVWGGRFLWGLNSRLFYFRSSRQQCAAK